MVSSYLSERRVRDFCVKATPYRPSLRFKIANRIVVFFMVSSLAVGLRAQQQTPGSYPDGNQSPYQNPYQSPYQSPYQGTQNSNGIDCSDPMEISAPECSNQTLGDQNQNSQSRFPQPGRTGIQQTRPNGNYTDTEQLNRPRSQTGQYQQTPASPRTAHGISEVRSYHHRPDSPYLRSKSVSKRSFDLRPGRYGTRPSRFCPGPGR